MNINEYQAAAFTTCAIPKEERTSLITNAAMGLCGESGEVADHIKKWLFQNHKLNENKIIEEIGDVMWYVALMATALDIDLQTVLNTNIDKLRKRYPRGFEAERSMNR